MKSFTKKKTSPRCPEKNKGGRAVQSKTYATGFKREKL